ncbi:hypothetical protein [Methylocystis parvus]|uniref:hypothetical protein n=1 Tax=Methylocystis parvus TaxID=134 RepID=UPI003C76FF0F
MVADQHHWQFVLCVTRPALRLAPRSYLDEIAAGLRGAGVQAAAKLRDSKAIFDWLAALISLQGINDAVALNYDARNGGVRFAEIADSLKRPPDLPSPTLLLGV